MVEGRVERGFSRGGDPPFSESQRIWLLERDLDESDRTDAEFRKEMRDEFASIRHMVSTRLNVLVAIGFSLLLSVIAVLVTVVASRGP